MPGGCAAGCRRAMVIARPPVEGAAHMSLTSPKLGATQPQETPPRPSLSVRWGEWMARRRWWVLSAWGVVMVAAALSYPHLMSSLVASDYSVTGSDAQKVTKLIESDFAAAGAEQDVIALNSDTLKFSDPAYQQVVDKVLANVRGEP